MSDTECTGYAWLGQDLHYCDDCGQPFWEHTHSKAPDGPELITEQRREHVRSQWCIGDGCTRCAKVPQP